MKLFKVEFETPALDEEGENDKETWQRGWYFVEESVNDLQNYISELYDEVTVRNLRVLMTDINGWVEVPVEKNA